MQRKEHHNRRITPRSTPCSTRSTSTAWAGSRSGSFEREGRNYPFMIFKLVPQCRPPIKIISSATARIAMQKGEMVLNLPQMALLPSLLQNMCTAPPSTTAHDDIRAQQPPPLPPMLPESAFSTTKADYEALQTPGGGGGGS